MALTAAEQYLLELINRARLDPAGEAARYGIDLNAGLAAGTISTASKQVLAPNALLENAAIGHSQWMLAADVFSHTGSGGSQPWDRAAQAGYGWSGVGENISWRGSTGTLDLNAAIAAHHQSLFLSTTGHRQNMLNGSYQEIGIAQEYGSFTQSGRSYNSSMLTELFGRPAATTAFLTGVIYSDTDRNSFYSIGEGVGSATIAAQGKSVASAVAGGYALALTAASAVAVTGQLGALSYSFTIGMGSGNVKVDIVNQNTLLSSGAITLKLGLNHVSLLGNAGLTAGGNANDNVMTGNAGANRMDGVAGRDVLRGMNGNDYLIGGLGNDTLLGGNGADRIEGGAENDMLSGNAGGDTFIFGNNFGRDTLTDFAKSAGDRLQFDDLIWGSAALSTQQVVSQFAHVVAGTVVFEFSANEVITLTGVTSTVGLADALMIV
jgi:Ca2+-binding RTX toxin-like protein